MSRVGSELTALVGDDRLTRPSSTAAQLIPTLRRFKCMPNEWALYHISAATAATMLRCTVDEVVSLIEHGLKSLETDQGPLFDYFDIMNVGRFSNSRATIPELNALSLLRFTVGPKSSWVDRRDWSLRVRFSAADQVKGYRVRIPDFSSVGTGFLGGSIQWPSHGQIDQQNGYELTVRTEGVHDPVRNPIVHRIFNELFDQLRSGEITYQAINEPLRLQHWQAWNRGMADCMVTSRVMADRLRSAGVQSRARRGFILGLVGSEHAWCEIHEDGRWKSVDVTLAAMPAGLPDARRTPAHDEFSRYCLGGRCNRCLPCIAEDAESIVWDQNGFPMPMIGIVNAVPEKGANDV